MLAEDDVHQRQSHSSAYLRQRGKYQEDTVTEGRVGEDPLPSLAYAFAPGEIQTK